MIPAMTATWKTFGHNAYDDSWIGPSLTIIVKSRLDTLLYYFEIAPPFLGYMFSHSPFAIHYSFRHRFCVVD